MKSRSKKEVPLKKVFIRNPNVLFRESNDGSLSLIDMTDAQNYYALDGLMIDLWKLLDGKNDIASLIEILSKKSKLPTAFVAKETQKAIRDFASYKLIVPESN